LGVLLENVAGVYATLIAGGTVLFNRLETFGKNYENLHNVLKKTSATSVILVPEILRILMVQIVQNGPLPRLRYVAVGGSKVSPTLIMEARTLGLPVYEGYGLSECSSVVALNTPKNDKAGTVGKLLPHIQAAVENGEIIIRNTGFLGYNGEQTPDYIYTGDLGAIDDKGFITITGRKKNVLITSYGRNIAPEWVESELLSQPEIAQAVVYGDGESSLSAFIVPSSIAANISDGVARANTHLPEYAHVKNFTSVPPFSPSDGTLTGTGRPRRSRIFQLYQKEKIHDVL
jgi:long-subunit acyl-CoA synthetase (AMP-forming)